MTRKDDNFAVPEKFNKGTIVEGPYKGDVLFNLDQMLDDYYRARDWDLETGLQTRAKLEELELDHMIPELGKVNAVK